MKIVFVHTGKAFLPELAAYEKYLVSYGCNVHVAKNDRLAAGIDGADLIYRFGGLLKYIHGSTVPEVHEYHSASTTAFPRTKNLIKSFCGVKPSGRVFLNDFVRRQYYFPSKVPFIFRDMGADRAFFAQRTGGAKNYDIVYAGSLSERKGLIAVIARLSSYGLSIGVAGSATDDDSRLLQGMSGVNYLGRLPLQDIPSFVGQGRFGLNYVPDIYPLNSQTSTKIIEYLAAGLPIISNKYKWIDEHAKKFEYGYLDLDTIASSSCLRQESYMVIDRDKAYRFEWNRVLNDSKFISFLRKCVE